MCFRTSNIGGRIPPVRRTSQVPSRSSGCRAMARGCPSAVGRNVRNPIGREAVLLVESHTAETPPGRRREAIRVTEPLRVEVPTVELGHDLMRRASACPAELGGDGRNVVVVFSIAGNPDRVLVELLQAVDEWLDDNQIPEARVHLDGRRYTLGRQTALRTARSAG